jgi:predicted nucleotide-binding protein
MYVQNCSLLVAYEQDKWLHGAAQMPSDRFLEYTATELKQKLASMDDRAIEALLAMPAIFATETDAKKTDQVARVGRITGIEKRRYDYFLRFEFDPKARPIQQASLLGPLRAELDIDRFELNRTHWAVKQVDLAELLVRHGYLDALPPNAPGPIAAQAKPRGPMSPAIAAATAELSTTIEGVGDALAKQLRRPAASPVDFSPTMTGTRSGRRVFIVHGHAKDTKHAVDSFLLRVGLESVILDQVAGGSKTIIEKFEHEAEAADFAVVLLTPDDVGAARGVKEQKLRARQNVIFELGYFAGKLGRGRVVALKQGDVEIPSDYNGVEYITFDEHDGWKLRLAGNLRLAGLPIDMTRLA